MKVIDLEKTIYELIKEYPEITDVVVALGHKDITNNVVLQFWGSITTLPKAAAANGKSLDELIQLLKNMDFDIVHADSFIE